MATKTVDASLVQQMLKVALQGGGQVKWKPTDKRKPHHPSSIQLPAVYETWKEPSRVHRRRTPAAAAAAGSGDRDTRWVTRSVPSLTRRDKSEIQESNSPAGSPSTKPKQSKPKNKKIAPPPVKDHGQETGPATRHKQERIGKDVEQNNSQSSKDNKVVTSSNKISRERALYDTKEKQSKKNDKNSDRLTDTNANIIEQKKDEKSDRVEEKSTGTKSKNIESQRKKQVEEKSTVNFNERPKDATKLPNRTTEKRTTERKHGDEKHDDVNHKSMSDVQASKSLPKIDDDRKKRTLANAQTESSSTNHYPPNAASPTKPSSRVSKLVKAQTESSLTNQYLPNAASPTKPPSRVSKSRIGSTANYRVNPRSKSDLVRTKPALQRRKTKTGYFTASGEFITNDEDGKQSEISAVTANTRKTDATTTSRNSKAGSEVSTATTKSSGERKPLRRRPIIITKKTLARQRFYTSVYNNKRFKLQRQTVFLKKVENAQIKISEDKVRKNQENEKKNYESVVRQYQALKQIRDRFDEDQVKRFSRQYVSWRSVETDRLQRNSTVYGLPDHIYDDRYDKTLKDPKARKSSAVQKKPKPGDKKFSRFARWVRNIKRFEMILKPNTGEGLEGSLIRSTKGALVEGRDIVEIHQSADEGENAQGPSKSKKVVKVRNIIGSAKRLLQATQDMDAISEVSDEDDDDADKARLGIDDYDIDDVSSLDFSDDDT